MLAQVHLRIAFLLFLQIDSVTGSSWDETPRPSALPWILSAALLFIASLLVGWLLPMAEAGRLMEENGPVETVQAAVLAGAAFLYLMAGLGSRDAKAVFCLLASAALVAMIGRELPGCQSVFFEGGACLDAAGKDAVMGLPFAFAAALLLALRTDWASFLRPRNLAWAWPVALSAAMLASAEIFEALHHQEFEELLEFAAYLHATAFAIWLLKSTHAA